MKYIKMLVMLAFLWFCDGIIASDDVKININQIQELSDLEVFVMRSEHQTSDKFVKREGRRSQNAQSFEVKMVQEQKRAAMLQAQGGSFDSRNAAQCKLVKIRKTLCFLHKNRSKLEMSYKMKADDFNSLSNSDRRRLNLYANVVSLVEEIQILDKHIDYFEGLELHQKKLLKRCDS